MRKVWRSSLLLLLAGLLVLSLSGVALADVWTDITDAQWESIYGITAQEADSVGDGFPDGTFRPFQPVTRGQFAKLSVDGFGIPAPVPTQAPFSDVPLTHIFARHIAAAADAELVTGFGDGTFRPGLNILRQQANTILGRFLSMQELELTGFIMGKADGGQPQMFPSLQAWFAAEGEEWLALFSDNAQIAAVHRPFTAYLVSRQIVLGSGGELMGLSNVLRGQSVALIIRVREEVERLEDAVPAAPVILSVDPASPSTDTTPEVSGTAVPGGDVEILDVSATPAAVVGTGMASAEGEFEIEVGPLSVGTHTLRARVTAPNGQVSGLSNAVAYEVLPAGDAPTVTGLDPASGPAGTVVVITGTNLTGATAVMFGEMAAATFTVDSATQITATAPAGAAGTTVDVRVTTPNGTSANTEADDFTFTAANAPTVTNLNPNTGNEGISVVITGTNFTGATAVKFGVVDAADFTVDSATQITAVVPAGEAGTTVDVRVTTPNGTSPNTPADNFTFEDNPLRPTITALDPIEGAAGSTVVITGTNFTGATAVTFGGVAAADFAIDSATQITAIAPAGVSGTVRVAVTTPEGTTADTAADNFTFISLPVITNLTPNAGDAEGQSVIIDGANFTGATQVLFGAVPGIIDTVTATRIWVDSPAGTPGTTVDVRVVTPVGTSPNTAADNFTFVITAHELLIEFSVDGGDTWLDAETVLVPAGATELMFRVQFLDGLGAPMADTTFGPGNRIRATVDGVDVVVPETTNGDAMIQVPGTFPVGAGGLFIIWDDIDLNGVLDQGPRPDDPRLRPLEPANDFEWEAAEGEV